MVSAGKKIGLSLLTGAVCVLAVIVSGWLSSLPVDAMFLQFVIASVISYVLMEYWK